MENDSSEYFDGLARLYELRNLIEQYETADLEELADGGEGRCLDCGRHRPLLKYGRVRVCREHAAQRIRVRNAMRLRAARDPS